MRSPAVQNGSVNVNAEFDGEDKTINYLRQLYEVGVALGEIDSLPLLLEKVAQIGVVMGHCEGCSILSSDGKSLNFLASLNLGISKESGVQLYHGINLPLDNSSIAGHCGITKKVLDIPNVYNLPLDAGFTWDSRFDMQNGYRCESILAVPMLDSKRNLLGVLELINHIDGENIAPFPINLQEYLRVLANQVGIVLKNVSTAEELKQSRYETVMQFVKACECRDGDMAGHIERIGDSASLIYRLLGHPEEDCAVVRLAAMLHDVGKISIPDAILKKPGILTPEERLVMQQHAQAGHDMLEGSASPMLKMGAIIAQSHHEKWDGSGYPNKIAGTQIPLVGRITALVDVFDALASRRVYKESWPIEKVFETLVHDSGTHFDPQIVELFINNKEEFLKIRDKHPPKE